MKVGSVHIQTKIVYVQGSAEGFSIMKYERKNIINYEICKEKIFILLLCKSNRSLQKTRKKCPLKLNSYSFCLIPITIN